MTTPAHSKKHDLHRITRPPTQSQTLQQNPNLKVDLYYHNYYTDVAETRKMSDCTLGSFFCTSLAGSYGYCIPPKNASLICDGTCDCMNCGDEAFCWSWKDGDNDDDEEDKRKLQDGDMQDLRDILYV